MAEKPKKPSRQEREWQHRHQEILDAAGRLFLELGYAGTTMQMIADEAEFSVGYLYKHFPGKKDLLDVIVDAQLEAYEEARREVRQSGMDHPLETLKQELVSVSSYLQEQAHLVPMVLSYEMTSPEKTRGRFLRYRREDAELLRLAKEKGEIRVGDPALAAAVLDGVTRGLIKLFSETGRMDRVGEIPGIVDDLVLAPMVRKETDDE